MGTKSSKAISKEKMDRRIKKYFTDLNSDFQSSTLYQSILTNNPKVEQLNNSQFLENSELFNSILKEQFSQRDFLISTKSIRIEESQKLQDSKKPEQKKEAKKLKKAEEYNKRAKKYFQKNKYFKALIYYKKSFKLEQNPKYTTNIARCFLKLERPDASLEAMSISIIISPYDFDGYRLAGIFAFHQFRKSRRLSDSYICLDLFQNAFDIEKSFKNRFNYYLARKMVYLEKQKANQDEKKELLEYMKYSEEESKSADKDFLKQTFYSQKSTPPKFLFCPITLEYIEKPIITPMGNSYEKKEFLEWCRTGDFKDPVSNRVFYSISQLAENKHLKKYASKYIKKYPSIFDSFTGGNDWENYEFL